MPFLMTGTLKLMRKPRRLFVNFRNTPVADQPAVFFGATHRLAALACRFLSSGFFAASCIPAALPLWPCCFCFFFYCPRMPHAETRPTVRAAGAGEKAKVPLLFQNPLHPVN
jgi:hypothetical protein